MNNPKVKGKVVPLNQSTGAALASTRLGMKYRPVRHGQKMGEKEADRI